MSPYGTLSLRGALVDRVDRPVPGLYVVTLAASGARHALVIVCGPPRTAPRWGIATERPRGDSADGEVRGLREKLESSRILRAWASRSELGLEVQKGDVVWWVTATRRGVSVAPPLADVLPEGDEAADLSTDGAEGDALVVEQTTVLGEGARISALVSLRKLDQRLRRRVDAIERDAAEVARAEERATAASLFVAAAAKARTGATELHATDWSSGEARAVAMSIDPTKSPRDQLATVFARAKRLRAGLRIAEARRDEAALAILLVDDAIAKLDAPMPPAEVDTLLVALTRELPGDVRLAKPQGGPAAQQRPTAKVPYRRFASRSGMPILVGKDARRNDELTVTIARPGDLWLHAKGCPGAHVVVPGWSKQRNLDPETLLDAATLAAHFSDQRGESVVDVAYADRRHVRKRRGSPPGLVEVTAERVILVRVEEARLTKLLASEGRDLEIKPRSP